VGSADGINLTAYCAGGAGEDYVTIINKTHGAGAADAAVTIVPPAPGLRGAETMTLAGGEPGDATGASATLGGAAITGDSPWDGQWSTLPADPPAGVSLTVPATTAAIVRIRTGGCRPAPMAVASAPRRPPPGVNLAAKRLGRPAVGAGRSRAARCCADGQRPATRVSYSSRLACTSSMCASAHTLMPRITWW